MMTNREQDKVRQQDRDNSRQRRSLDDCYGRIGIPAVAAAVRPRRDDERQPARKPRVEPYDRD